MHKCIFFLLVLPALAGAQCPEDPKQHIGSYKRQPYSMDRVGVFGRTNLPQISARLDAFAALLQQAMPQPRGCSVIWTPMPYEDLRLTKSAHSYYSDWFVQPYYCDKAAHKLALDETPLSANFVVNGIDKKVFRHFTEPSNGNELKPVLINGKPLLELPPLAGQRIAAGTHYHLNDGGRLSGNQHTSPDDCGTSLVLITKPGKELFSPVSREQIMDYIIAYVNNYVKSLPVHSYESVDHGYYPTRQSFDDAVAKNQREWNEKINRLITFKNGMSARERQMPAYVIDNKLQGGFSLTEYTVLARLDEGRPVFEPPGSGSQLVTLNEDYFDTGLPSYIPQVISFNWSVDANIGFVNDFNRAVLDKFNFRALADLLGK